MDIIKKYYKEDFKILVTLPEGYNNEPFEVNVISGCKMYKSGYDGKSYTNCKVQNKQVLVSVGQHCLSCGLVEAEIIVKMADSSMPGGVYRYATRKPAICEQGGKQYVLVLHQGNSETIETSQITISGLADLIKGDAYVITDADYRAIAQIVLDNYKERDIAVSALQSNEFRTKIIRDKQYGVYNVTTSDGKAVGIMKVYTDSPSNAVYFELTTQYQLNASGLIDEGNITVGKIQTYERLLAVSGNCVDAGGNTVPRLQFGRWYNKEYVSETAKKLSELDSKFINLSESVAITPGGFIRSIGVSIRKGCKYAFRVMAGNAKLIAIYPYGREKAKYLHTDSGVTANLVAEDDSNSIDIYFQQGTETGNATVEIRGEYVELSKEVKSLAEKSKEIDLSINEINNEIKTVEKSSTDEITTSGFKNLGVGSLSLKKGKYLLTADCGDFPFVALYPNGTTGENIIAYNNKEYSFELLNDTNGMLAYIQSNQTGYVKLKLVRVNTALRIGELEIVSKQNTDKLYKAEENSYMSLAMFDSIGVCGDSYTAGAIFNHSEFKGEFEHLSWGKCLERMLGGVSVSVYAQGGTDTNTFLSRSTCMPKLLNETPKNLYVIALGINDAAYVQLGTIEDIHSDYTTNPNTYYGNYGRIIEMIKAHAPKAKIVLSKVFAPNVGGAAYPWSSIAIEEIASHYGLPYLETKNDSFLTGEVYTNDIMTNGGHPTAPSYSGQAKSLKKLIELAMYNNMKYFFDYLVE